LYTDHHTSNSIKARPKIRGLTPTKSQITVINRRNFTLSAAALTASGFTPAQAQSEGKIFLGQSAAFTGAAAQLGIQFNAGAKVFFDQLNSKGGIHRKQIEIVSLDDAYEPDRCVENTKKFISDDVFALFGYIGTPTSLAALPLAAKANLPFIAPFTGAMGLREPLYKNVFHLRASYNDEAELIVKQLNTLGLNRIAVFYQNDAYGKAGLDGVIKALTALNLKPVAVATVERNSTDVAAAVSTLAPTKADAIIQISAYKSCAAFIRAARTAGYGGQFYNVSFVGTQALSDELGKDGAGVVISQVVPSPYSTTTPISREFATAIAAHGKGVQANFSSMEGYLAARMVADGLQRAGPRPTRDAFINGMEAIGRTDYAGFSISLSSKDHVASHYVNKSMLTGDGRVRA
jgi:branched-chain amino acid transport system substrate-binding protein